MGLYNFSFSFGPAIAPALGGHLIEVLNWRAIFYINVPVGLLSAGIILYTMPNSRDQHARPFDAIGVFSMAIFLVGLLLAVSEGRRYGWGSEMVVMLFMVTGVALLIFVYTELTIPRPFVNVRLYANIPFTMGCLIAFLSTMEFRGTNFLLPIMLQRIFHYTPFQAGLFFLPPALVMGTVSILAGRLSDKVAPKPMLIGGLIVLTYVSFQFCFVDAAVTTGTLLGLFLIRRAAQAFCNSPLTSAALHGIPEDQVRMASGVFNLHRTLAGAVGVALTATLMDARADVHTVILSERQSLYPLGTALATEAVRTTLQQEGYRGETLNQMTSAALSLKLADEATLAGYQDLFFLFAMQSLLCLIPVLLMRGGKLQTPGTDAPEQRATPRPSRAPVRGV